MFSSSVNGKDRGLAGSLGEFAFSSAPDLWWSMIFSENRHPPIGSKPEGKLFRIMPYRTSNI
jgi:hypothetical protein